MAEPSMLGGVEPHIQQFAEIYDLPYDVARRVVEGELTLEDAVEAQFSEQAAHEPPPIEVEPAEAAEPPVAAPSPEGPASRPKRVANFDPGFRTAVDRGWLTVQQAVQRGNREAFATRLSRRHDIPMAQALKIADNRVRLAEVLRKKHQARERAKAQAARTATRSRKVPSRGARRIQVAVASLSLVAAVLAGFWGIGRWRAEQQEARTMAERSATPPPGFDAALVEEPRPATAPPPNDMMSRLVEVEKNEMGMLARIVGPDPRAVLNAYCGAVPGLQPLGLTDTVPPFTGARRGVFRDLNTAEQKSIVIRRDHRSGQWRAGDGTNPISPRIESRPLDLRSSR